MRGWPMSEFSCQHALPSSLRKMRRDLQRPPGASRKDTCRARFLAALGMTMFRSVFRPHQATASVRLPRRFAAAHRFVAARDSLRLPSAESRRTRFLAVLLPYWLGDGVEV